MLKHCCPNSYEVKTSSNFVSLFTGSHVDILNLVFDSPESFCNDEANSVPASDALSSPSYDQVPCSVFCDCLGPEFAVQADCSNRSLTVVPNDLNHATVKL
ncbi:hypothetical protein CEXT_741561 [Caerostris extrusa]|uniref:Uncharacterized protein n=1 Tax=Caerostris extrusa TaxID=172846 RepID=A0AAV4N441_CAEEX|nr:hypothetical protein CEXT_741561 [Caerostris extrusa]